MIKEKVYPNKINPLMEILDENGWGYEIYPGYGGGNKIIVCGLHIEQTFGKLYVMNGDGDDIYSTLKPVHAFNFIQKTT